MKYNDDGEYKDIYIKTFDTLPVGAEVDYTGSTIPDGWTQVDSYSTSEVDTGQTWIDGKTIYRKVIDYFPTETIGAANTTTNILIPHNITNLGQVTNARCISETNNIIPSQTSSSGTTLTAGNCITQVTSTNINFRIINDTWSSRHFYIILEYTKSN